MQYNYPYNQSNAGYVNAQMSMQQQKTQPLSKGMSSEAPRGTTPLAGMLPPVTGSITGQGTQMGPAGQMQAITSATSPVVGQMQMGMGAETPVTVQSPYYTAGFLKNFIGKNVRVEFVLGTAGATTDRVGTLLEVGASYIVIQPLLTDDLLMCDLYSIRFVTIVL